ncbi:hypothetical protein, partial [Massilia eurypsychrophila]
GIVFNCGDGFNYANLVLNSANSGTANAQRYDNCEFNLNDTHPSSLLVLGSGNSGDNTRTTLANCRIKLTSINHSVSLGGQVRINGGSMPGTSTPTLGLFNFINGYKLTEVLIENFDFSALSNSAILFIASSPGAQREGIAVFRNCKLPAGWVGSLVSASFDSPNLRVEMYNCDSGATNYRSWVETWAGSVKSETVIVKTGGASDGTTPKALKMAANTNANEPLCHLLSPLLAGWIDTP